MGGTAHFFGEIAHGSGYFPDRRFDWVTENQVLWASRRSRRRGSETIGYAVNPAASGTGMMEYWNVGMLGLAE